MFSHCVVFRYDCESSELSMGALFGMGGLAGSLYWILLFPADAVKSKMQSDAIARGDRTYRTIVQVSPFSHSCSSFISPLSSFCERRS